MHTLPKLSIVIPAYNEAERIDQSLDRLKQHCETNGWSAEAIVVNDFSDDDTGEIVQSKKTDWPELHWAGNGGNRGTGSRYRSGAR